MKIQNRDLSKDSLKNNYLLALTKGFNSFCQSVSALVLFILLFIGISLGSVKNAQAETIITNTATATFSINGTAQTLSDSAQFTKDAVTLIPMTLLKQANKNTAKIGDVIDYTLTINNPNNTALNSLTIEDTLPAGLVYKIGSATLNRTSLNTNQITNTENLLSFSIGSFPALTTWSLSYQLNITQTAPTGVAINQAIVYSAEVNSNSSQANITIIEPTPVIPLDLVKSSDKTTVKVGDTIHYTLNIENKNSYTLNNIRVKDTLPTGLEYKFGSTTLNRNGSVDNSDNNLSVDTSNGLTFSLGNIPASAKWTLGYDVIVKNTATSNRLTNLAQVLSDNSAANSTNSQATVELISESIIVNKQANKITANIDDEVTYTVIIENPNQRALTNLVIEDTLPTGFVYKPTSAKVDGQSLSQAVQVTGSTLQFSIAALAKRKTITLSYTVSISQAAIAGNEAINTVKVTSDQASSDPATATVKVRTPSIIDFLIVDEAGTEAVIPPTSYNDNQNGGRHWQEINSIVLADGSRVDLPTPLRVSEAQQYTVSDPIIIQVTDLDQNLDPTKLETIIVTVSIPGTNDKEVLLLTETSPDSGIFRGVILTTTEPTQVQNGLLTLADGVKINVNYRDEEDSSDSSRTAALVVPSTTLPLTKTADKYDAAIGELVRYTLAFENTTRINLPTVNVIDKLPVGFRFLAGSAKLNGKSLNNEVAANGRGLNFKLENMPSNSRWVLEYVTKISAGVQTGKAINSAQITTGSIRSNTARATVYIRDELMRDKNILTGRVYIGCRKDRANNRNNKYNPKVLKDARIYMETGRSVLSDEEGFWHMEGVQPGSHVLQLDVDSLPVGYEPLLCRDNTRHAGDAKSKFVDLQPGSLWQVDFYVKANPELIKNTTNVSETPHKKIDPLEEYGNRYLKSATPEFEILWPKNNYVPAVASTKIMVKSAPKYKVEVFLNGKKVNPLNYDGSDTNKARTITIRRWKGVDLNINKKDNELLVILKDKSGKEIARQKRNIHFSGNPYSAELLADQSVLVADGKTTPVIALLIKDKDGFPMRANTHGYYIMENSNYQPKTLIENKDKLNLNKPIRGIYKYLIGENGIARIKLNPTTQSGELRLKLKFPYQNNNKSKINKNSSTRNTVKKDRYKIINVWLKPHLRKWIMVGIAEGTLGYQTLSGNMQTLKDLDQEDGFYKRGRIAFFAKGRVKGKYLLTVAYDTHKRKQQVGSQLNGNIDPNAWYTIYADNSNSQYDAPSSRKLYLKLEKDNFYALFGDYHTGLTVTELANYERVLNGIKTEYKTTHKGKQYSVNAFISETSNKHQRLEFPGDGTSGVYYLSRGIVQNSEKVKIETRDRFRSDRILETRHLIRYQDYEIDYDAGTLFFKFPVTGRDQNFNPNIIVVDYDSLALDANKSISAGGRVSTKTIDNRLEVGVTVLNEGRNKGKDDRLIAADATYYITPDTRIHAEIASSNTQASNYQSKQAYIIELQKEIEDMEARLYLKKRDNNFGINAQASESGTVKAGASVRYKLNQKTNINAEILHQENTTNNNQRQLAQAGIEHRVNEQLQINAGVRHSREEITDKRINNNTVLLGGRYTTKDGKVTLRSNIEKNIGSNDGSEISPDRAIVGVDVNLKNGFTVFAEHETTDNGLQTTNNNRVGVTKDLWKGANAKSTYTQENSYQGQRDYATLGLSQKIKVTDKINADISIDRAKTINDKRDLSIKNNRFNTNEPTLQGSQRDDYTAFSVGLGSNDKDWSWTTRFELRKGKINDKLNFQAGVIRHLNDGKNLSAKLTYRGANNNTGDYENHTRLSLGSAWHPKNKHFVFLNRLDLVDEDNSYSDGFANNYGFNNVNNNNVGINNLSGLENHTQKIIHNMHYNRKINDKTQISIHHGIKHVKENNKGDSNSTTIDTATVEVRRDLNKKWDIGVHGGYLHDWGEEKVEALVGVSVGVTPMENAWLSLGYNFEGFYDKDFDKSNYKRQGTYMDFRYKFNQDSFDGKDLPIRRKPKNKTMKDKT